MLIHPPTDEILEQLWVFKEQKRQASSLADLGLGLDEQQARYAMADLIATNSVRDEPVLELLPAGEELARAIIRRHRLAEILFSEVLELEMIDAEASACEFEHMLTERVVDRVCTFLGHPPKCPHGKPIPQGSCCSKFEKKVDPLISRLLDLPIGGRGTIVFIAPKSLSRLNRLAVLGVTPGSQARLLQRQPSVVISCGETSIAIEEEMAGEIYVRPDAIERR